MVDYKNTCAHISAAVMFTVILFALTHSMVVYLTTEILTIANYIHAACGDMIGF